MECNLQHDSEEKQIAMESMDLVYRGSRYTVGLLAIILQDQDDFNFLQALLIGLAVVQRDNQDYPRLARPATSGFSQGVLICLLTYLRIAGGQEPGFFRRIPSSIKMDLLF